MTDKKLTEDERRRRINESDAVLPGDKQRAEDEREHVHEDRALDTGTSISTTENAEAGLDSADKSK
jgi:hypothetical protein